MTVTEREVHRPKHLPDINKTSRQSIRDSRPKRQNLETHKPELAHILNNKSCNRAGARKRQERKLFQNQPAGIRMLEATQRPIIEQQENERHGHEHRFAEQAANKQDQGQQIMQKGWSPGIAEVSEQGQEEE